MFAKKADLLDIQRILNTLEAKVDKSQFQSVIRGIETKMERQDTYTVNKASAGSDIENKVLNLMAELNEVNRKFKNLDEKFLAQIKDRDLNLESLRQNLTSSIQNKADYRDIENVIQKLHQKVDNETLLTYQTEIRQEVTTKLNQHNKESQTSLKKKDDSLKTFKQEIENQNVKVSKDVLGLQDKLQRLAAQFDKELMTRDKQIKQFKNMSQEDIARSVSQISSQIDITRKQLQELDVRKADKRDLLDQKQKLTLSVDAKIDKQEVHGLLADFT